MTILAPGITVYFVRHGETDWNREARYQGQRDIPLNQTGRAQAQRNGLCLKAIAGDIEGVDYISSPLSRAVETMRILRGELGLDPETFSQDDRLRELHYGHWEGVLATDLPNLDPEGMRLKALSPYDWRPRGGESYADLQGRVIGWLSSLKRDCVAVSHGGVSRVARGAVFGVPSAEVPFLPVPQDKIMVLTHANVGWI